MPHDDRPADAVLDHQRLHDAVADLPRLLRIADQARGFYGPIDCADGECEHVDGPQQCPLLEARYATADDLDRLEDATETLRRIHALAQQGLTANPADALTVFEHIADLTQPHDGNRLWTADSPTVHTGIDEKVAR